MEELPKIQVKMRDGKPVFMRCSGCNKGVYHWKEIPERRQEKFVNDHYTCTHPEDENVEPNLS